MKMAWILAALLVMCLILAGCGGDNAATPPTQLSTEWRLSAAQGDAILPTDALNTVKLQEGVEVHFYAGKVKYQLAPKGGLGGYEITCSFWSEIADASGNQPPSYSAVQVPFSRGEWYPMYHPAKGAYVVQASFHLSGKMMTTSPLRIVVGPE